MRFFNKFDGNNILFFVWIALIILYFYDVEAKGWKFHRKVRSDIETQLNNVISDFDIQNHLEDLQHQSSGNIDGGNNNE
ncbi:MAG: hypothetical protein HFE90_08815 [Firmicutes bacterium]|nr:hypothetical protein [Bacillota bacterium]